MLFNAKWAIFQPYHGENKLLYNEIVIMSILYSTPAVQKVGISFLCAEKNKLSSTSSVAGVATSKKKKERSNENGLLDKVTKMITVNQEFICLVFCIVLCLFALFVFVLCLNKCMCPKMPLSLDCPFGFLQSLFTNAITL